MPSNADLKIQIAEQDERLRLTSAVEGLTNKQLGDLLKGLKEQPDVGAEAPVEVVEDEPDVGAEAPVEDEPDVVAGRPPHTIIDGKALTTKKGVKADGEEVKAEWLSGGQGMLDHWVALGYVAKN